MTLWSSTGDRLYRWRIQSTCFVVPGWLSLTDIDRSLGRSFLRLDLHRHDRQTRLDLLALVGLLVLRVQLLLDLVPQLLPLPLVFLVVLPGLALLVFPVGLEAFPLTVDLLAFVSVVVLPAY